jgi:hypothetical protein
MGKMSCPQYDVLQRTGCHTGVFLLQMHRPYLIMRNIRLRDIYKINSPILFKNFKAKEKKV